MQILYICEQRTLVYTALTVLRSAVSTQWQQSFPSLGDH